MTGKYKIQFDEEKPLRFQNMQEMCFELKFNTKM